MVQIFYDFDGTTLPTYNVEGTFSILVLCFNSVRILFRESFNLDKGGRLFTAGIPELKYNLGVFFRLSLLFTIKKHCKPSKCMLVNENVDSWLFLLRYLLLIVLLHRVSLGYRCTVVLASFLTNNSFTKVS
jgi:hypothetical protein